MALTGPATTSAAGNVSTSKNVVWLPLLVWNTKLVAFILVHCQMMHSYNSCMLMLCSGTLCIPCSCKYNGLGLDDVCAAILQASSKAEFCNGVSKACATGRQMQQCAKAYVAEISSNFNCCEPPSGHHSCELQLSLHRTQLIDTYLPCGWPGGWY